MADTNDQKKQEKDPTGGATFREVVETFLKKPPKPHKKKGDDEIGGDDRSDAKNKS